MARLLVATLLVLVLGALSASAALPRRFTPTPAHNHTEDRAMAMYMLAHRLVRSVETRDFNSMNELLDDSFVATVSQTGCDKPLPKATFIQMFKDDFIGSETATVTGWVQSSFMGVFSFNLVGVFNSTAPNGLANQTVQQSVIVALGANEDFTKIVRYWQFQDRSAVQANATQMVAVFDTLVAASLTNNISVWDQTLASDSTFTMWAAFDSMPPVPVNRSAELAMLAESFTYTTNPSVKPMQVFAACDFVIAEFDWGGVQHGRASSNHFFYSMILDSNYQVKAINEFPTKPWY